MGVDKVKEAHRRVMVANHPDAGGSHYLASKINEAKDMMLGKSKGSDSAFWSLFLEDNSEMQLLKVSFTSMETALINVFQLM